MTTAPRSPQPLVRRVLYFILCRLFRARGPEKRDTGSVRYRRDVYCPVGLKPRDAAVLENSDRADRHTTRTWKTWSRHSVGRWKNNSSKHPRKHNITSLKLQTVCKKLKKFFGLSGTWLKTQTFNTTTSDIHKHFTADRDTSSKA